ncbi:MAG: restriction endonuclease [bacterium]|nr:restriction endonuclease [bacterium]
MEYALKERIGKPDLFVGRKKELTYFLKWIENIKQERSQSTAILARRKMGKTAIMERLFNLTFHKNDGVIPFYYEVKEINKWMGDFCVDFFLTFVYQYIAFKTRNTDYLRPIEKNNFDAIKEITRKEGFDDLTGLVNSVEYSYTRENIDILWDTVREAPKTMAARKNEYIVQMIDEFQFLNAKIYRDKGMEKLQHDLAGAYLSTAESKIAPLLVSGSWVGWLMNMLIMMLPARFKYKYFANMPENEAIEMVFKYSSTFEVPVTGETAYLIAALCEGSPFYISSIMRSECDNKDLTTIAGLTETLEFETLSNHGVIKGTWMEYVKTAFSQVNDRNAKRIVLYLFKNKGREVNRKEILQDLNLDMSDTELEKKMEALAKADIIEQGQSNYDYRCVTDNIFDKVFRGVYQKEIEHFDISDIKTEYLQAFEELKKRHFSLQGKYNAQKGNFAEYLILNQLKYRARRENQSFKSITRYLPEDFNFCDYSRVWRYDGSPEYGKEFNIDIFATSDNPGDYSIIGEIKHRETKKFSKDEVLAFEKKVTAIKKLEKIDKTVGFIFSSNGFTKEAEAYCKKNGIALSDNEKWLSS